MVKSKSPQYHIHDLAETFTTLQKYKMKLNPLKCTFGISSGKFVGFLLTVEGIKGNPDKVKAILNMLSLKTPKEPQCGTGRIAALSHFISKLDDQCSPFFKTLRGANKLSWNDEFEKAFQQLKQLLASPPLLQSSREGEDLLLLYFGIGEDALSSILVREEGKK